MELKRIFDILDNYLEKYPMQNTALASKKNGKWEKIGIREYVDKVDLISYGLIAIGVRAGDKVGIVSGNRPEWNMIDFATMQIGAVSVPIYPTISQSDYTHILKHADMKVIFIEGKELRNKLEPILPEVDTLENIFTFSNEQSKYRVLDELIEIGKKNQVSDQLKDIKAGIKTDDLATIIYTSGTTGTQKGVMLSHSNIVNQLLNLEQTPSKWNNTALSFLPLCHAYERVLVYLYQHLGMSVYYAENLGTIGANIKEVTPTMMSAVPRVLEKMYDKLYAAGQKLPFAKRAIYYWAFNLATKYQLDGNSAWMEKKLKLADTLIYSQWRKAIGGNFDIVVSGGSALQSHMGAFFSAIGMPVFEGYGLSETSPVIAVSQRGKNGRKFGTVGPPLPGVELKISEQNEIMCRGHNVMIGYYKDPDLTAQVIDKDGWFHTGDTGKFTPEGQLMITGRLKNLFKTSFGKYVNPEAIELKITESRFIENMVVLGENKKFAAALVLPDFDFLKSWCIRHKIEFTTPQDIIRHPQVIKRYVKEIRNYDTYFGSYEQLKRIKLIADEWSANTGILSPTLKVKRQVIEKQYAQEIEELFK